MGVQLYFTIAGRDPTLPLALCACVIPVDTLFAMRVLWSLCQTFFLNLIWMLLNSGWVELLSFVQYVSCCSFILFQFFRIQSEVPCAAEFHSECICYTFVTVSSSCCTGSSCSLLLLHSAVMVLRPHKMPHLGGSVSVSENGCFTFS